MNRLTEREAQALAVTEADREEGNENNPIVYAESAPNRFQSLTYFFPEEDGVEIVQDLDWPDDEPKVYYFWDGGREEITEGALFDWALEKWGDD